MRELTANASSASLFYRAPVLDALSVDGLTANLVRLEPQRFNFSDIIERLQAKPKTDDAPARFSVNNIRVSDGTVNFDDRPVFREHIVSDLKLGIPFLSNLPTDVEIDVQPALSARVNGTPLEVKGETRPFAETLESLVDLKLDGLDLRRYLAYSPVRPNFTLPSGTLSTDLSIVFRRAAPARGDRPATDAKVLVSGLIEVTNFELAAPTAQPRPLIGWKSLSVMLEEVGLLARRAVIADVTLVAPTVEAARDAAGALNWQQFLQQPLLSAASDGASAEAAKPPAAPPPAVTLKHASVRDGTVNITDDSAGRFTLQLVNLSAEASNLTTTSTERGKVSVKHDIADGGGSLSAEGDIGLAPLAGRLAIAAHDVRLRTAARYLAHVVNGTLDGSSDVSAVLEFAAAEPAMKVALRDIAIRGKDISLRGPKGSGADFELTGLQLDDGAIDLTGRMITLGKIALDAPRATVRRLPDGEINWMQVMRAAPTGEAPGVKPNVADAPTPSWTVVAKEVTVERGDLRLEDLAVDPNVRLRASAISGSLHNVVGDGSERAEIALQTRFGSGGTLSVNGGVRIKPLASDLRLDARSLDVSAIRPYLAQYLNATLARAELSGRGRVTVDKASNEAPVRTAYKGGARLGNLHLLDASGENDLLKWQVLDLDQIDARLGDGPPQVTVGKSRAVGLLCASHRVRTGSCESGRRFQARRCDLRARCQGHGRAETCGVIGGTEGRAHGADRS